MLYQVTIFTVTVSSSDGLLVSKSSATSPSSMLNLSSVRNYVRYFSHFVRIVTFSLISFIEIIGKVHVSYNLFSLLFLRLITSTAGHGTGLYIILGILHHLTALHDESLVQVWIIDGLLLPGIAAAATHFVKVEEEGSGEDTGEVERERDSENVIIFQM